MKILYTRLEVSDFIRKNRTQGNTICLVPTMGFFHDGHLALMKRASEIADCVLVTLFVNPTQFALDEDLNDYPRDFAADCEKAKSVGVQAIFCPDVQEMYPQDCLTVVNIPDLTKTLCGMSRPTHFAGVATVVVKLFNICQTDFVIFGEKDFQQLTVIRQMVQDLNIPVKVHSLPIVREHDGLAMSSRNSYLSRPERIQAVCLFKALQSGRKLAVKNKDRVTIIRSISAAILKEKGVEIDYIAIVNQYTLTDSEYIDENSVLAMAVKIGKTRLIDNGFLLNWR